MNVYDFDGTIYKGDSTIDFYLYSLKHNPLLIRFLPIQLFGLILYLFRIISKTKFKEYFFCFLKGINTEYMVCKFWEINQAKIFPWYISQHKADDIVISASPEFLIKPICSILNIENVIASRVDSNTGKFTGNNCYGQEKVKRLKDEYEIDHIDNFYSDSLSDTPLADISANAYLVKGHKVVEWERRVTLEGFSEI